MLLGVFTVFLLFQCGLELKHVWWWLCGLLKSLLGVGVRSVERIIEGEIKVARYLLLVRLSMFWLLFLE